MHLKYLPKWFLRLLLCKHNLLRFKMVSKSLLRKDHYEPEEWEILNVEINMIQKELNR